MRIRTLGVLSILPVVLAIVSCAPKVVRSGPFTQVGMIPEVLSRGVSSGNDVIELLGEPNGKGGAVFPPVYESYEIYYYEDIEVVAHGEPYRGRPFNESVIPIASKEITILPLDIRNQLLLVFLKDGVFEGYQWVSNTDSTRVYSRR